MTDEEEDMIYDLILKHQIQLIEDVYGKQAADGCNYGWAVDVRDWGIIYTTKIYSPPLALATTYRDGRIMADEWIER